MPKVLTLARFGNPILRQKARRLTREQIRSPFIQELVADIRHTNKIKQYGVGLAAPQVGESVALSVIGIKPTPNRPKLQEFETVIINPSYEGIGKAVGKWEGCQSCGTGDDIVYAKTLRFSKIQAKWHDEHARLHKEDLSGFVAHVFQHEADHVYGKLFVDKVVDPTSFMMADEYRKRIIKA